MRHAQRDLPAPVQDAALHAPGQLAPGRLEVDAVVLGERAEQLAVVARRAAPAPRGDRAAAERQRAVGHHERGVELVARAEPAAARAGAVRAVEGEEPRRDLGVGDAAVDAGVLLGEHHLFAAGAHVERHQAVGQPQRRLDRLGDARAHRFLHPQAVHDHVDRVPGGLGELDLLREVAQLAVDARAHEALAPEPVELLAVLALAVAHHRREHLQLRALAEGEHAVGHLLHGLARDRLAAAGAVGLAHPREEQAQVVGDLGGRADGGAGIAAHRLLLDGDGRREPLDRVDVGLGHLLQELPRVGRERLHVAALTLGVERVEGERRLARARQARDHHEAIARDADVDVAEVVLPGAADHDLARRGSGGCHGVPASPGCPWSLPKDDGAKRAASAK